MCKSNDYRDCPYCAEEIKIDAVKCKHCKSIIEDKVDNCDNQSSLVSNQKADATLILRFKKNPLQILQWGNLNAVIDGRNTVYVSWTKDEKFFVEKGKHRVQMSFSYMGGEVGKAEIEFNINNGEQLLLTYKPPIFVFDSGTILVRQL